MPDEVIAGSDKFGGGADAPPLFSLKQDEIKLSCSGIGGELPLPLWERVGVRGYGLSIDLNPSPGSHLSMRSDLSHKGRGEANPLTPIQSKAITLECRGDGANRFAP
jgi:hypothetical protein